VLFAFWPDAKSEAVVGALSPLVTDGGS